jgi:hypothetical protein
MTVKEYEAKANAEGLDFCEDLCPLRHSGDCPGGMVSGYGGQPIEPPCCSWSEDEDLDELPGIIEGRRQAEEDHQHAIYLVKKEKEEKNHIAARRRQESARHVYAENSEIKRLKKRIRGNSNTVHFQRSFGSALNFANSCMAGKTLDDSEPEYPNTPNINSDYLKRTRVVWLGLSS